MIGLIAVTMAGRASAARLAQAWPSETRSYDGPARQALHRAWAECDGLVCFLAVGATTRLVAPLLDSKWVDPAVVCVDEPGRYAVTLVGGHAAGANALCTRVADVLDAQAIITTATDATGLPGLDTIEAATDDIRAELVNVLAEGQAALEPYISLPEAMPLDQWRELNNSRRWGVYFLWREGVAIPEHIARCPRTVAALEAWPRCDVPGCGPTAVFSILDAKTRIPGHTGVTNTRLTVHLPLIMPPGCGFRVGAEVREWHPGKAFVFDDTIEHEAWNDSDVPRAVLILDIWSPFVSKAERELVRSVTAGVGEYYGTGAYCGG